MKRFIITIDTESDNQWNINHNQSTENAKFIPRFQILSEKYGFKPVYLIDYSMANDEFLIEYLKNKAMLGLCEIGMHLHAWDTPPVHQIDHSTTERPYLIEYPKEIMEEKIINMTNLLSQTFEQPITSHRAGRWAINNDYVEILSKYGYKVDCSITPGINWINQKGANKPGPDYSKESTSVHSIGNSLEMWEVPMTIRKMHNVSIRKKSGIITLGKDVIKNILGRNVWLRPALFHFEDLKKLINVIEEENEQYLEFMMHSSELMPAGSPYYTTQEEIEMMYTELNLLFEYVSKKGYCGSTLTEMQKSLSLQR